MFRTWLSRPLYRKADIDARLDAVESLMSTDLNELTVALQSTVGGGGGRGGGKNFKDHEFGAGKGKGGKLSSLRGLPDMERLLSRVHRYSEACV